MVKEPLLSVLTLGQTYDEFLLLVEPIIKGSESKEDFVNVMIKDFYTDDDYSAMVFFINQDYNGVSPLADWFGNIYDKVKERVD